MFRWTQAAVAGTNTLGNGVANIVYTPAFALFDADQLGIQLVIVQATTNVIVRLQWSNDNTNFIEEKIEADAAPAGGIVQKSLYIAEWGPQNLGILIPRPVACGWAKVGIYSNGAPTAGDDVNVLIARQRGGQLQTDGT